MCPRGVGADRGTDTKATGLELVKVDCRKNAPSAIRRRVPNFLYPGLEKCSTSKAYPLGLMAPTESFVDRLGLKGSSPGFPNVDSMSDVHDASSSSSLDLQNLTESLANSLHFSEKDLAEDKMFRILADYAPVGIYLNDANGKTLYVNRKCAELVGVPAEESLNFAWVSCLHPDDRECMVSAWETAYKNRTPFRLEYRWVHSDGKVVWTLGEVTPIPRNVAKDVVFVGTLTDITARKEAEAEKQKLQALLVQAQKMEVIGRLAGGVAHDYNNMLSVIMGHTELTMKEVDPNGSVHEALQEILKTAERSAKLTRQLLTFAREEIISPLVLDLNEAVPEMFPMLSRLIGERIQFVWRPQDDRCPVKLDPAQLDQILVNLCLNAGDAISDAGEITVRTAIASIEEAFCTDRLELVPGRFILLSIRDSGCGMDQETIGRVFEPFFTTKFKETGTGLGLATVYGIVKQNGGFIDVQSQPGEGATFNIYLPLATGEVEGRSPSASEPDDTENTEVILVVEDEASLQRIVKRFLERAGFKVLVAGCCSEALVQARLHTETIDLLITDVVLPEVNGKVVAQRLQAIHPEMKCLYMSGYSEDIIANQGVLADGANFIQKPFNLNDLSIKIRDILNRTSRGLES